MKKVISIEFLRFVLMLQICLWHYSSCVGFMSQGYIAVEFFFILSGYLMYHSYMKENSKSILDYTISKIRSFFPKILFAFILFGFTFDAIIRENPERIVNDLSLLSGVGILKGSGINSPIWYISALIVGGGMVYAILRKIGDIAVSIIFPLVVLLVYSYILTVNNYSLELWNTVGGFHMPFWRGVAGICLGCIVCKFQILKKNVIDSKYVWHLNVLLIVALYGYIVSVFSKEHYDGYAIICFVIIILASFSEKNVLNRIIKQKFWLKLGALSFDMFILHAYVLRFIYKMENVGFLEKDNMINIFIYVPLLLLISYLFDFVFKKYIKSYIDNLF